MPGIVVGGRPMARCWVVALLLGVAVGGCSRRASLPGADALTKRGGRDAPAEAPSSARPLPMASLVGVPIRDSVRTVAVPADLTAASPSSRRWVVDDDGQGLHPAATMPDAPKAVEGWEASLGGPDTEASRMRTALPDGTRLCSRYVTPPPIPRPPNADFFDLREIALFRPGGDVEWKRAWSARVEQAGLCMSLTADGKYWGVAASDYPDRPFSTWVVVGDARDGRILWQTPNTRAPGLHVQFSILGAAEAVIASPAEGGCTGFYGRDGSVVLIPGPSCQENSAGDRVYVRADVEPKGSCLLVCYDIHGRPLWRVRDARPRKGALGGFALSPSGEWLADLGVDPAAIYEAR